MSKRILEQLLSLVLVMSGKLVSQGAALACGIVAARVAGPQEFALYAAAASIVLLIDACAGAPLDYAVVTFAASWRGALERVWRVQAAAFRFKLAVGALLTVAAAVFGDSIAALLLHDGGRGSLVVVAAVTAGLLALVRSVSTAMQSDLRFVRYFSVDAGQGAIRAVAVLALALFAARQAEWYMATLAVSAGAILIAALTAGSRQLWRSSWPTRADVRAIGRFTLITSGVIALGTVTGRTDVLLLFYGHADGIPHYAGAVQLASIATMLAAYATITAQPHLIPARREGRIPMLIAGSAAVAAILGAMLVLLTWRYGDSIAATVLGADFAAAGHLLFILMIGTVGDLVCMPVAMTFVIQTHPRHALWGELAMMMAYLVLGLTLAAGNAEWMAWLVTAIRLAKALFYVATALRLSRPGLPAQEFFA